MSRTMDLAIGAAVGLASGALGCAALYYLMQSRSSEQAQQRLLYGIYRSDNPDADNEESYTPPLPPEVKEMLTSASLCHLSCNDKGDAPHTSLMNFTFVPEEEDLIIMTTRKDTKKYRLLSQRPDVSLLVHDFPQISRYRQIHLEKNRQYENFIEGEDKAVITVKVQRARMCNVKDQVTTWEAGNAKSK
ncbi:hypothetical protein GUITHDRAFT_135304 [Guillardia theta CCMP2712]|uniref:Pyridoxamine 5'-phosphate oxidase N-terminal domain-containing protein n=1 Tax=Guillardia theta (strain CCMP2712) TaxID=905079 RepID=L1JNE2_GUITC|nr:hypothetical protein GUITHDRAFT_135304 [Guillardia theta CCMP2712]EKX50111.1 hypothetical protein GUITHDRAFT_135304 [Guillardia theta CCMP2712]|eukprot:XP_005837091.1 hypothetical protein GUITHDRAFT_135304 [Guillardia theta CCMP2712]